MTRKLNRNYSLSLVVPFVAILTTLITAAVLAQTSGAGQRSARPAAVSTRQDAAVPMGQNPPVFLPPVLYDSAEGWGPPLAIADLNGDGNPDIVAGTSVLLGNGHGWFSPPVSPGGASSVAVADMNGDGK